ncbi:MAG: hypothetical protein KGN02_01815 [bacterium]|nr:hypothetical protein [bacterium]
MRHAATAAALAVIVGSGVAALADGGSPGGPSMMNDVPYAKVKAMLAHGDMKATIQMAMKKGAFLMGGMPTKSAGSKSVALTGEIVDANCYSANGYHGHNHALCAKVCILQGSPLTFLTSDGTSYTVVSAADAVPIAPAVYDIIGNTGVHVEGYVNERGGVHALTITSIDGKKLSSNMM